MGYEGRYQVSSMGRVKAISFMQRSVTRYGKEFFRRTKERITAVQPINSGYLIAHLHLNGKRKAYLVHRLVATAFVGDGVMVNHKNGEKQDNRAINLEWVTDTENKLHAVSIGLNTQAIPVVDPATGKSFGSIAQAARITHRSPLTIRTTFLRSVKA